MTVSNDLGQNPANSLPLVVCFSRKAEGLRQNTQLNNTEKLFKPLEYKAS